MAGFCAECVQLQSTSTAPFDSTALNSALRNVVEKLEKKGNCVCVPVECVHACVCRMWGSVGRTAVADTGDQIKMLDRLQRDLAAQKLVTTERAYLHSDVDD